jgi:hypothetical protein
VALLLKDRDATPKLTPEPPHDGPPVIVPDFACETCGAAMQAGQDWCLECGTAAPGRLGAARPGWRAAFTVVSLTTLLVVAAVIASYAALTSDAERQAAAPSQGDGAPISAGAPVVAPPAAPITPGATGPGTVPPTVTPPAIVPPPPVGTTPGKLGPIIPTTPPPAATNTPVTPPAPPPPAAAGNTPPPPPAANTTPQPQLIDVKSDAASTYDPYKRAGAEFGPAKFAVDGKVKTVWDVTVPVDGKPIAAGLMLDLGKPYSLRALRLRTPTDGFRIEIYGAESAKETPEDLLDKRWEHLTDIRKAEDNKLVSLHKKSENKIQLLLLYVTTPAEPSDPRAAIGNVEIAGTP